MVLMFALLAFAGLALVSAWDFYLDGVAARYVAALTGLAVVLTVAAGWVGS
jgi:hypothetical protein